mmetsp:Transcript_61062/g.71427  ORF Transcript_61062/g.71427 Transcript_61062/m.71427 type:complete len:83 (+) Transcript_61062:1580-1828(+)
MIFQLSLVPKEAENTHDKFENTGKKEKETNYFSEIRRQATLRRYDKGMVALFQIFAIRRGETGLFGSHVNEIAVPLASVAIV